MTAFQAPSGCLRRRQRRNCFFVRGKMKKIIGLIGTFVLGAGLTAGNVDADALNYSNVDVRYGANSTMELDGGSFDADDAISLGGSYLFLDNFFVWGRWSDAMYDLNGYHDEFGNFRPGDNDFGITQGSVGLGGRFDLNCSETTPVDGFVSLSYEYIDTDISLKLEHDLEQPSVKDNITKSGLGLKLGVKAAITPDFTLTAAAYEVSYGKDPLSRSGGLDGLSFEIEAAYSITESLDMTLAYSTGELDYAELEALTAEEEKEVDREQVDIGLRLRF